MAIGPQPGRHGWSVEIGKGPTGFGHDGFADAAAADAWAAMATQALKQCTIRLGPRRVAGTGAEALRRWATDQGTLPLAEGGTHLAPMLRLADLAADPLCAWPLAALRPADLAALRTRRQAALGDASAMLVEQAALAAAIDALRALYLPHIDNPFLAPAADGVLLLDDASCARIIGLALGEASGLARAVALVLTTGLNPALLTMFRARDAEAAAGLLRWPTGYATPWPSGLPGPEGDPAAALLGPLTPAQLAAGVARIGSAAGHPGLSAQALWLTGMTVALRDGVHLDEVLVLAGLHQPVNR